MEQDMKIEPAIAQLIQRSLFPHHRLNFHILLNKYIGLNFHIFINKYSGLNFHILLNKYSGLNFHNTDIKKRDTFSA